MEDTIQFLSLQRRHSSMSRELSEAADRVIRSGVYINGGECRAFAAEMGKKLGLANVVPVSNGLDAIRLIIRGFMETGRLKAGDEVILPANTYIATLLPVTEFNLKPILVRPDLRTFGLDWKEAEQAVTDKTRAVITVHLYGTPSWDFEIASRMRSRGILLIEDNAQAIGASIGENGKRLHYTGSLGDAAAFSFYPTKNIGALGDAGAVATKDEKLASAIRALANYGCDVRYHNKYAGYNCRMDELQAAFLRVKLALLDAEGARRTATASFYASHIRHPEIELPAILPDMGQVWHQYVVRTRHRDELKAWLEEKNIATDIHYPVALYDQECYRGRLDDINGALPIAERLAREVLSLPIADVTDVEARRVAEAINGFGKGRE